MSRKEIIFMFFICISYCSLSQLNTFCNDSIEITLIPRKALLKKTKLPNFKNEKYLFKYNQSKDTLSLKIILPKDTLLFGEKNVIYMDYTVSPEIQILKIPAYSFAEIKILIIEFNTDKIYIFRRKRKSNNCFILKYNIKMEIKQ